MNSNNNVAERSNKVAMPVSIETTNEWLMSAQRAGISGYRFFLINERTGEQVEIDEPVKFDGFKPKFKRDKKAHGVTWEYAEQQLDFYGRDGRMIKDEYERYGIDARVVFLVECACGGEWEEFYRGMINFVLYSAKEGANCFVSVGVAQTSIQMTLNNRAVTKVDLNSLMTFDGSHMQKYTNLGKHLNIPAKTVRMTNRAVTLSDHVFEIGSKTDNAWYKLSFGQTVESGLDKFDNESSFRECGNPASYYAESIVFKNVQTNMVERRFHVKVRLEITHIYTNLNEEKEIQIYRDGVSAPVGIGFANINSNGSSYLIEYNGSLNMSKEDAIVAHLRVRRTGGNSRITIKAGSFIEITGDSYFAPTNSKVYMVHETLSRLTETITDNELTVKSDYFGRRDSEVNPTIVDGIGSLRCFTNGLMLRQAKYENAEDTEPKFTVSLKDIYDGLIATDAIGWSIEEGKYLRFEQWEYFYKDEIILVCDDIAEITRKFNHETCFAQANIGYAKWEAEERDGIDGFHGKRQYRTDIKSVDNELTQHCKFVADGYAIEATRRRMIADESSDWRYDNDIFILDLDSARQVNTGAGNNAMGLHDAKTVFNVELSPARNAARWYSYIMQGTKGNEMIFAGAEGYAGARTESQKDDSVIIIPITENTDITPAIISLSNKREPRTKSETVEFNYPLTFRDFKKIKENPYGLIQFNGEVGWIREIEADLIKGIAKFILIPKYIPVSAILN